MKKRTHLLFKANYFKTPLFLLLSTILLILLSLSCGPMQKELEKGSAAHITEVTGAVDDASLTNAVNDSKNWLSYGLNYSEDRHSKLTQITTENVTELG